MSGEAVRERDEVIVVLCRANVARSPLAGVMLRAALDTLGRHDILVHGAGLEATPGAPASLEAVQIATGRGLDLSGHTSVAASRSVLANAALILTMTEAQRSWVSRLVPKAVSRAFTLTELSRLLESDAYRAVTVAELATRAHWARPRTAPAEAPEDVPDPIGRPLRQYQRTADRMARAIDVLTAHLHPAVATPSPPAGADAPDAPVDDVGVAPGGPPGRALG
jgi:protein-tyrosine phosphatase